MGNRVYDPIHDVFQVQDPEETNGSQRSNYQVEDSHEVQSSIPATMDDDDGESTQSEDNSVPAQHEGVSKKRLKEPSKYVRHLKKPDGEFFNRKDIQFQFLHDLFSDQKQLFTNTFKSTFNITPAENSEALNVTDESYVARKFISNDKLTFSEYYLLTIASSTKCSKILRDKLLFDRNVAFSTCVLSLLVNTGRLNTTINFFLEMTSQLRTFHSIPCLQRDTRDPKSLQDTPRLKSILKNLPQGNENVSLTQFYETRTPGEKLDCNPVNLIFNLCDNVTLINLKLINEYVSSKSQLSFFDILDNPNYDPMQRAQIFLWILYIHLETDMTEPAIQESLRIFGVHDRFELDMSLDQYDVDTPEEVRFGEEQREKRLEFLKKNNRLPHDAANQNEAHRTSMEQTKVEDTPMEESQPPDTEKPGPKRKKRKMVATVVSTPTPRDESVDEKRRDEVNELIEQDRLEEVASDLTQEQLLKDLQSAQLSARHKREELGLVKLFNEFEDVTMATVIGVRGKKRKKFSDGVLGFETDFIRTLNGAKQVMLMNRRDVEEDLFRFE
ncbi:LAFE_0B06502g1_1 [Lachancea fermentati]|uniref:LAFE_0B06502g1_1 n=1 Tax=Lachancea fermentati TaxID=4955 RepID=A0A1G4M866_LACFM|nr:LAFE_0B06502g1_1 [Lachancea fermentati]